MIKHEERAREIHKQGNNCSYSLYTAYEEDTKLDGTIPLPRSEAGKCGAAITAEKILKELGKEDKIEEFEKGFLAEFGNITCAQLMRKDRRCNDYVGKSAELIDKLINEKEQNIDNNGNRLLDSRKYKRVLFDLDNTLIDDDKSRRYAIEQVLIKKGEISSEEKIEKYLKSESQFWKDKAEGKIKDPYVFKNKEEKAEWYRAQRFIRFFKNISFEEGKSMNEEYIDYLGEMIVPINNAQEIIKYLYEKNYEIYIITNGPKKIVDKKLNKINIKKYIKDTFCSEEAGHMKPHKLFFEFLFDRLGFYEKNEMIIVGDDLGKDILGGIENDIDTCWFNSKRINNDTKIKPKYEINDLIELKQLL